MSRSSSGEKGKGRIRSSSGNNEKTQHYSQVRHGFQGIIKRGLKKLKRSMSLPYEADIGTKEIFTSNEGLMTFNQNKSDFEGPLSDVGLDESWRYLFARVAELEKLDKLWRYYSNIDPTKEESASSDTAESQLQESL